MNRNLRTGTDNSREPPELSVPRDNVRVMPTALDLLLPTACAGCGARGAPCCRSCRALFADPARIACAHAPPVYALASYRSSARQLVLAYKERGRRDLAPPLGRLLAAGVEKLIDPQPLCLVPAPSRRTASRVRGGPHVQVIARRAAEALEGRGYHVSVTSALRLDSGVRDAVGLDAASRTANLAGHVRVDARHLPRSDATVLLVDDIVTTGATACESVRVLQVAGANVVAVLTVAYA